MDQIKLKAVLREQRGKQAVKKLRREGWVPATVYRRGEEPVAVSLAEKEISKIVHTAGGENMLVNLAIDPSTQAPPMGGAFAQSSAPRAKKVEGAAGMPVGLHSQKKSRPRAVIIKEIQHHPVKRSILHVDLHEISLTEKITVEVEVVAVGEPVGVRQEGGTLDHPLRELKVQCLPTDIPKNIEVEVSGLKLNDTFHVRDLKLSDKLKVLNDPDTLLLQVKLHVEEKVEETPVEGAAAEPEVIREKKEEESAAGAKAGEKIKEEPKAKETPKAEKK